MYLQWVLATPPHPQMRADEVPDNFMSPVMMCLTERNLTKSTKSGSEEAKELLNNIIDFLHLKKGHF